MQPTSVKSRTEQSCTVVELFGEIDCHNASDVRERLRELVALGNTHLVLDLDQVGFLDSTGLGVLVGALKRVRALDGSLHVVCANESLLTIFRITGLNQVFDIHPTLDRALAAAGSLVGADTPVA